MYDYKPEIKPLASNHVKITIKQEIKTHTHTHTHKQYSPKQFLLSGCFSTCIFNKKNVTIDERKSKMHFRSKSISKIRQKII